MFSEKRVKNKFFTRQVCAASSTNIGTLAARKGGSQHEYKYAEIIPDAEEEEWYIFLKQSIKDEIRT